MSGYRLRPRAAKDLEEIADFIARDNPARALSFIEELLAVCARIGELPRTYPRRGDLAKGLRQAVHGRYLILFTADDRGVVIERIVHGARRLEDLIWMEHAKVRVSVQPFAKLARAWTRTRSDDKKAIPALIDKITGRL